MELDRSP